MTRHTQFDYHFRIEGRKTWFECFKEMQVVLDEYLVGYNTKPRHQGRGMNERPPLVDFREGLQKPEAKKEKTKPEKQINPIAPHSTSSTYQALTPLYKASDPASGVALIGRIFLL